MGVVRENTSSILSNIVFQVMALQLMNGHLLKMKILSVTLCAILSAQALHGNSFVYF